MRDPLSFFIPDVFLSDSVRAKRDAGQAWADVLPAGKGEMAVIASTPVDATGDRLLAWVREIEVMFRGRHVLAMHKFAVPPRIEDLDGLILDSDDLEEIRRCRPGECGMKLSATEMAYLRQPAPAGKARQAAAFQARFRHVMLARAQSYLAEGYSSAAVYNDRKVAVSLEVEFKSILSRYTFLEAHVPRFATYLEQYPRVEGADVESFLYWSKESIAGRPIISITHLSVWRGEGMRPSDVLVAFKQVFATRYIGGSLAFIALLAGDHGRHALLVYLNRSHVDVFEGPFSGIARWILRRRVRAEAPAVLDELRRRLETGNPPVHRRQVVSRGG